MGKYETPDRSHEWYEKAKIIAERFVHQLNPSIEVDVDWRTTTEHGTGREREGWVLWFHSDYNPGLNWTMEIKEHDDYLATGLKEAIRKAYKERSFEK